MLKFSAPGGATWLHAKAAAEQMAFDLSLFTTYSPFELSCVDENGETVAVTWLGWAQGGCQGCWSDVLPRVLALNGRGVLGDKTVLELGAGCGVIGLLASRWAVSRHHRR